LLSKFGYSLGKWILEVKVRNKKGDKLSYIDALRRTMKVWFFGDGLSIPFVCFITNIISYSGLTNRGKTRWDDELEVIVSHEKISELKMIVAVFILIIIPVLISTLRWKHIII